MPLGRPAQAAIHRLAPRAFWIIVPLLLVTLWPSTSHAYAWMIRHGFAKCGSCHVDPSGGETLTNFGRVMSDTTLSTTYGAKDKPNDAAKLLYSITEPEWLRLGGSFRFMNLYQLPKDGQDGEFNPFPMQMDTYGQLRFGGFRAAGSLGLSRVPAGSQHAKAAQITSGNGDDDWNLISRHHWIGYDISDFVLIRGGRINLPFGIRVPEHVMWVRDATRTDRESDQQTGVALSYSQGKWRGELMAVLGNYQISPDEFRERGYSMSLEYLVAANAGIGVSSLVTHAQNDRIFRTGDPFTRQAHGLTARYAPVTPLVFLAEMDLTANTETGLGYVGMLQADVEPVQGLHFMATGELVNTGAADGAPSSPGAGEPKFGGWLSAGWFFYTHWDVRFDAVMRQEEPVALQAQLHFYF